MPWPHKNSDGVIPAQTTENPFADLGEVMHLAHYNPAYQYKYQAKVLGTFPAYLSEAEKKNKLLHELKKYGIIPPDFSYKEDPVVIKATKKPTSLWHNDWGAHPVAEPIKMKAVYQRISTEICGKQEHLAYNTVLDTTKDYTESEIRAMLEKGFSKITDEIIKKLKEKK